MKAVVVVGNQIEYQDIALAPLLKGWARVRVTSVGLCGTDVAKMTSFNLPTSHTRVLGHEFIGEITEMNGNCDTLMTGDLVACMPILACGNCNACLGGMQNLCIKAEAIGRTTQGAFAEYVNAPMSNLTKILAESVHKQYVLADTLAVCLHAIKSSNRLGSAERTCLIVGDGIVGCLLAWLLQSQGHRVTIKGIHPENLHFAERFGIDTLTQDRPLGLYDTAYETVGRFQSDTLDECIDSAKPGGSVIVLGVYTPGFLYPLAARKLFIKETGLIGVNGYMQCDFQEAVSLIDSNREVLAMFISHNFPLSGFAEALETAQHKKGFTMKIVLDPGG